MMDMFKDSNDQNYSCIKMSYFLFLSLSLFVFLLLFLLLHPH